MSFDRYLNLFSYTSRAIRYGNCSLQTKGLAVRPLTGSTTPDMGHVYTYWSESCSAAFRRRWSRSGWVVWSGLRWRMRAFGGYTDAKPDVLPPQRPRKQALPVFHHIFNPFITPATRRGIEISKLGFRSGARSRASSRYHASFIGSGPNGETTIRVEARNHTTYTHTNPR